MPSTSIMPPALRLKSALVAASVFLLLSPLLFFHLESLHTLADYVRQKNPFSGQGAVQQAFTPTDRELACLNGLPLPDEPPLLENENGDENGSVDDDPIPDIVHFVFLQNPQPGAKQFDFLCYLAVRSALISIKPSSLQLHLALTSEPVDSSSSPPDPLQNPWIRRLSAHVTIVHHPSSEITSQKHPAHAADLLRLSILRQHGGIYLDTDAYALRPFTRVLRSPPPHDIVMGHEGGNRLGLCNAVVAARANSSFLARWIDSYRGADLSAEWNYHSVLLPGRMAEEHPRDICTLPPDSFFWPTWTWDHVAWMHEPLSREEARFWRREIDRTGGALFDNQLAYHAWGQMGWDRYLKHLTPAVIRGRDTRFNLLMRRFLEDDL